MQLKSPLRGVSDGELVSLCGRSFDVGSSLPAGLIFGWIPVGLIFGWNLQSE